MRISIIALVAAFLSVTAFTLPVFAEPASVVAKPQEIPVGGETTIFICEGGLGCNFPVVISSLFIDGPASDHVYLGGTGCPTSAPPFSTSGEVTIGFGTSSADASCWAPVADTDTIGDYFVIAEGTEGRRESHFLVKTDFFVIPEVPVGAIGLLAASLGGLAAFGLLRRKPL